MNQFIQDITRRAGAAALERFGKVGVKYTKANPSQIVTEADLAANEIIVSAIKAAYPDHGIVSEEMDEHQSGSDNVWYVDPIDGTRNYVRRTPLFGVMVALAHRGELALATVFNPCSDELYFAAAGQGATKNGEPIHCSDVKTWAMSFGCVPARLSPSRRRFLRALLEFAEQENFYLSILGSVAMPATYVADGRRDWFYSTEGHVWDYAAPALILREAGCTVTNFQGESWRLTDRNLVAAPPSLHPTLLTLARTHA